jgi:hypothetical protein
MILRLRDSVKAIIMVRSPINPNGTKCILNHLFLTGLCLFMANASLAALLHLSLKSSPTQSRVELQLSLEVGKLHL